jgi:hypothetical protein
MYQHKARVWSNSRIYLHKHEVLRTNSSKPKWVSLISKAYQLLIPTSGKSYVRTEKSSVNIIYYIKNLTSVGYEWLTKKVVQVASCGFSPLLPVLRNFSIEVLTRNYLLGTDAVQVSRYVRKLTNWSRVRMNK